MNRAIDDNIVEEIRSRCDIVEIINNIVPLKKSGATWKCCCPFHNEKTPSFIVNAQRQHFHCFGCGKGGDVFSFIMAHENMDFPNAVHYLASRCGVIIPEKQYSSPEEKAQAQKSRSKREKLFAINALFAEFYRNNLKKNPQQKAAQYLDSRGIPYELAETFMIGGAPDSWDASLNYGRMHKYSDEDLLDSGIVLKNPDSSRIYDRFRDRLVFPICDEQGRVVAFSARTLEKQSDGAKYVNSPETAIFRKSAVLYGLSAARKSIGSKNFALLCEGQFDVIAMHRANFDNAVAPQGTAFTDEQARILKRYCSSLYIAFDSDEAGRKAAIRAIELALPLEFEIKVVNMPPGSDPDSIYASGGAPAVEKIVDEAVDFFDFLCYQLLPAANASPAAVSRGVSELIPFIQKIPNAVTRELYVNILSTKSKVQSASIFNELNRFRKRSRPFPTNPVNVATVEKTPRKTLVSVLKHAENTLLEIALHNEELAQRLGHELNSEFLSDSICAQALNELIKLAMIDEWDSRLKHLADFEREHSDPDLSSILNSECHLSKKNQLKAFEQSIEAIKKHYGVERSQASIMERLRNTEDAEEKRKLLLELQNLNKK